MDLYIGCVAEHMQESEAHQQGRVGIGHVAVLNGVTVEGSVGYYNTTFVRGCLLSLIVPLLECQRASHILIHCDMPSVMGILQQDKIEQSGASFNPLPGKSRPTTQGCRELLGHYRQLSGFHTLRFDWFKPHSLHWGMVRAYQLAESAMRAPTEIL